MAKAVNAINVRIASISQSLPPLDTSTLPAFLPAHPIPTIQVWDAYTKLKSTNCNKSPGPDGVPALILKEFACEISGPFCELMNSSFREGIVPHQWKEANVIPLPKTSPPDINELRPISLTAQLAKHCERFAAHWIMQDISTNLDPRQFGCRKNRSTTHALISMLDFLYKSSSVPNTISTLITTDFSKAFDLVDHTTAVKCLIDLGVRPSLLPWICSFMSNRRQRVRYHGQVSDWQHLSCGVAQGTILGPIIFLALINSALRELSNRWKYVDDMNLTQVRFLHQQCSLQTSLDNLSTWVREHKMKMNSRKCKALHICFARTPPTPEPLLIDGQTLETVVHIKVLGVTIQSDLKWDIQVDYMISASNRKLFLLRRLKRPTMEYAAPVWHPALTCTQSARLERQQKRACRIILGTEYTDYTSALSTLNLDSLAERRTHLCLTFAKKLLNSEFSDWLPPSRKQISGRNTRSANKLDTPICRTTRHKNSAIPYMTNLLNKHFN
ncbi:hypothetical protein Bbelb_154190 [Branchiostoma belcheri]|nr:hypothetical protein Bbelb_154190 [Branchiostoma belcheri]